MSSERAPRYSHRSNLLQEAEKIVTVDRNKSYGEPDEDFQRIAAIASAMGFRVEYDLHDFRDLTGSDVARFMIALKLSRLAWNPTHRDSWLDLAGYAACGFETAQLEADRRSEGIAVPPEMPAPAFSRDLKAMADKAVNGDPKELEETGYILTDATVGNGFCELPCDDGHTYLSGCKYRIKKRRNG